ncbi:MinD/ParA family protein [Mycobacterium sp. CBMA293]|nr:MinD/ParA family protein [Mycolicibacterium sp. CBMA 360]MUL62365.1 MinD/ParA family protein [Mycolicibacterium sp. CBMA 335]MUM14765.1 MinD/ParA family protein [Mycolicibacterium sp. CBMA 293]
MPDWMRREGDPPAPAGRPFTAPAADNGGELTRPTPERGGPLFNQFTQHLPPVPPVPYDPRQQPPQQGQYRAAEPGPGQGYPPPPQRMPIDSGAQPPQQPQHPGAYGAPQPGPGQGYPPPPQRMPIDSGAQPPQQPQQEYSGNAQGSAAPYVYTNTIRRDEMVPTRKLPPKRGWRKGVYLGSAKLINPGQSPDEREEARLQAMTGTHLRGHYRIGVVGKGGVGKSTLSACIGSVFAENRQNDRVVAIDADTAFGKLGSRIDPSAASSYWEVAADQNLNTFADMRARVGSNSTGLFVLIGEPSTRRRRTLNPEIYDDAIGQLDRHFSLSIVDCGSTMDAALTLKVLSTLDALVVVSSPWYDGASTAGQTLEWLGNNGYTALLQRTVVVINDSDGHVDKSELKKLSAGFAGHGQKVFVLPYDDHLRPGGVINVQDEMNKVTHRRVLEICAALAEHFASATEGRGSRR